VLSEVVIPTITFEVFMRWVLASDPRIAIFYFLMDHRPLG
jgi:hypothetical protein